MFRSVIIFCLLASVAAFHNSAVKNVVRKSQTIVKDQEVKDLNLEEMFEVFDKADTTVSSSAIPKGQAGSTFVAKNQVGSSAPLGIANYSLKL